MSKLVAVFESDLSNLQACIDLGMLGFRLEHENYLSVEKFAMATHFQSIYSCPVYNEYEGKTSNDSSLQG